MVALAKTRLKEGSIRGRPCEQGQAASRTGCIPRDGSGHIIPAGGGNNDSAVHVTPGRSDAPKESPDSAAGSPVPDSNAESVPSPGTPVPPLDEAAPDVQQHVSNLAAEHNVEPDALWLRIAKLAGRLGVTTSVIIGSLVSPASFENAGDSWIPRLWDAIWGQGEWADEPTYFPKEMLDMLQKHMGKDCCDACKTGKPCCAGEKTMSAIDNSTGGALVGNKKKEQPSDAIDPAKACQILDDGTVNGEPITDAQRGMFGAACNRKKRCPDTLRLKGESIRGRPCKPGQSAKRSGCVPKKKPEGSAGPKASSTAKPDAAKKPSTTPRDDSGHAKPGGKSEPGDKEWKAYKKLKDKLGIKTTDPKQMPPEVIKAREAWLNAAVYDVMKSGKAPKIDVSKLDFSEKVDAAAAEFAQKVEKARPESGLPEQTKEVSNSIVEKHTQSLASKLAGFSSDVVEGAARAIGAAGLYAIGTTLVAGGIVASVSNPFFVFMGTLEPVLDGALFCFKKGNSLISGALREKADNGDSKQLSEDEIKAMAQEYYSGIQDDWHDAWTNGDLAKSEESAMEEGTKTKSYFSDCPRDEQGHCKPSGTGKTGKKPKNKKPESTNTSGWKVEKLPDGTHAVHDKDGLLVKPGFGSSNDAWDYIHGRSENKSYKLACFDVHNRLVVLEKGQQLPVLAAKFHIRDDSGNVHDSRVFKSVGDAEKLLAMLQ